MARSEEWGVGKRVMGRNLKEWVGIGEQRDGKEWGVGRRSDGKEWDVGRRERRMGWSMGVDEENDWRRMALGTRMMGKK